MGNSDSSNHSRRASAFDARLIKTPRFDDLVQRVKTVAKWEDLTLPGEQCQILRHMAAQALKQNVTEAATPCNKRGKSQGVIALFAGPCGTMKTLAAAVLAIELHVDLYRIDLSAVVNKYIGETEKNLRRLFDAAEDGGMVLFFDEADALFGKRSDVRDCHDRYANIDVNYLLQRIEAYRGLAILATNMKPEFDAAFLRRIRFIVQFPFPDAADRTETWADQFPLTPSCHNTTEDDERRR